MWREAESEVVRLTKVLAHNDMSGEALFHKFQTASREDVRLAAALRGYFTPGCGDEAQRQQYLSYLCRRVRPAAWALMEENRVLDLEAFAQKADFSPALVDEFLDKAIELKRPEVLVWLLEEKKRVGFRDRDFSL